MPDLGRGGRFLSFPHNGNQGTDRDLAFQYPKFLQLLFLASNTVGILGLELLKTFIIQLDAPQPTGRCCTTDRRRETGSWFFPVRARRVRRSSVTNEVSNQSFN